MGYHFQEKVHEKGTRKRYLLCEDGIQKDKSLDLRAETW